MWNLYVEIVLNIICFNFQEVWTLCRILKRNTSHKKNIPDWRDQITTSKKKYNPLIDASSKTCSGESDNLQGFSISFQQTPKIIDQHIREEKPVVFPNNHVTDLSHLVMAPVTNSMYQEAPSSVVTSYSNFSSPEMNEFVKYGDWEDLRSFVEFAGDQCMI